MSDRQVPLSNAEQAVRMTELEAEQRLLQQQFKSSIDGMRHSIDSVQLELRALTNKVSEMTSLQHQADSSKEAMARVEHSISEMRESFESWMHDTERAQEEKWRRHEDENKQTRDQVIRWGGVAFGITLVGGILVTGFVAFQQMQNTQLQNEVAKANQVTQEVQAALIKRADTNAANINANLQKVHEIELYLARGGATPREPYQPRSTGTAPQESTR